MFSIESAEESWLFGHPPIIDDTQLFSVFIKKAMLHHPYCPRIKHRCQ